MLNLKMHEGRLQAGWLSRIICWVRKGREEKEMVRVSKGKLVLTNSVLHSRENLYESVRILRGNIGNPVA